MYAIQKNVAIPAIKRSTGRKPVYPFRIMKRGDSFVVDTKGKSKKKANGVRNYMFSRSYIVGKEINAKFTVRTLGSQVRVWRIK